MYGMFSTLSKILAKQAPAAETSPEAAVEVSAISPTAKIYVVTTDFPVTQETVMKFEQMFAPIREKYGLDFIVLEPGLTLKRFDDI